MQDDPLPDNKTTDHSDVVEIFDNMSLNNSNGSDQEKEVKQSDFVLDVPSVNQHAVGSGTSKRNVSRSRSRGRLFVESVHRKWALKQ